MMKVRGETLYRRVWDLARGDERRWAEKSAGYCELSGYGRF